MHTTPSDAASPPGLDAAAQQSFRRELVTAFTMPLAIGMMEGGFVGVVADKIFAVHPGVLALITAAPMFGNLSSFAWARLAHGRRKVPFIVALQVSLLALMVGVALLPAGRVGGVLLAVQVVAARFVISGIITVRSTVWRLNYPRFSRGRIAGRLVLIASLTMMVTSLAGSFALDANADSFRLIYPLAAALAILGVASFSRVRVRDERDHLARERRGGSDLAEGTDGAGPGITGTRGLWGVLRGDLLFRRYMTWQFLLGVGNMMIQAPLIHLVSRRLEAGYFVSIGLISVVPLLMATLTMAPWGGYLDRVHVAEFRKYQCAVWMASHVATWVGALLGSVPLIALGRVILGIGRGGGAVAWQIGHHDFSSSHMATLYMGVHATLTGVRGAIAPFAGMLLYLGWPGAELPGLRWHVPGFAGIGPHVFLVASGFSVAAGLGFLHLHRRVAALQTSS